MLDWRDYDSFDWGGAKQTPLAPKERQEIETLVADVLGVDPRDRAGRWGAASPPGRFAATVVQVHPETVHCYLEAMAARRIGRVGVKVFKTTQDARREARRVLAFHRGGGVSLPGLPNDRVQKSLDAGARPDRSGRERHYVVQEWVAGETLEALVRRLWKTESPAAAHVRLLLEQLFAGIIIPLWSEGTIWWDVRDANYCWDQAAFRLRLIDTDALAAYADEIVRTPACWQRREKGRVTALARLRQMAVRLAQSLGCKNKKRVEQAVAAAWENELAPFLRVLGPDPDRRQEQKSLALAGLHRFLDEVARFGAV